jgi:VanZ family protein
MWSGAILLMAGDRGSAVNTWNLMAQLQQFFPFLQTVPTSQLTHYVRVVGHILAYGLLAALWLRACMWQWPMYQIRVLPLSLGMTFLVAVLDEVRQSMHPSRSGTLLDVLLDLSSALTVTLVLYFVFRSQKKPMNNNLPNPENS